MAKKIHLNSPKNCIFSLKKGFEPQYFTLRTLEKYGNLSVKNVLKISPKLRHSVLINFVLIRKKECNWKNSPASLKLGLENLYNWKIIIQHHLG